MGIIMLQKGLSISPLKLQKMLYYQQAWHMVFFGKNNMLFNEIPEAWVNGPVYPTIYNEYKNKVQWMCDYLRLEHFGVSQDDIDNIVSGLHDQLALSQNEESLMDRIVMLYGSKSQDELVLMTHSEEPWCEQRIGLLPYQSSNKLLSLDTMFNYYKNRFEKNHGKGVLDNVN